MNNLIAAALNRKRTVISLLIFLIFWGVISYLEVPKESTPDVKIPIIFIEIRNEGMSPSDAERLLVRPVEQEVKSIEGIKEMRSTAYEEGANVVLEFHAGFDSNKARFDVREAVDKAKSELPPDADEPVVGEVNLSLFPIMVVKLSGQVPLRTLYRTAQDLSDRIEAKVSSVLKAEVVGDREEAVEILVDPVKIDSYGIAFGEAIQAFSQNNQTVSAGNLDVGQGRFSIKLPGLIENVTDIMNLPVIVSKDAVVTVQDIAKVHRTFKDPLGYARDRGLPAVAIEVSKRTGENLIETVEAVKKIVASEQRAWKGAIQVAYAQDDSNRIRDMLHDLQNNLILAVLLVMVVIVLSLGWRPAMLVGIAVPGAFLTGILVIASLGFTLNIVVLFSLIFSIGMLVDAAIITVEYADRKISEGATPYNACLEAGQRMAWPVITSIGTILVVFLPLLFWPGTVGQFMKFMPITLLAILTASIMMALFFLPAIGSSFLKRKSNSPSQSLIASSDEGDLSKISGLTRLYVGILKGAIKIPKTVLFLAAGVLVTLQWTYKIHGKGVEFFPDIEPDVAMVQIHARDNLSVQEKDALVKKVENKILDMEELDSVYTRSGAPPKGGRKLPDDIIGTITVEMTNWKKRRKAREIINDIEERTKNIPGIIVEIQELKPGPPAAKPIDINIRSRDLSLLEPTVLKLLKYMEEIGDLKGIEDNRPIPGIDWTLTIDRAQASKFTANVVVVGNAIRLVTNGVKIATYRPDDARDEIDILIRYNKEYRSLQQLDSVRVATPSGSVPVSNFIKRTAKDKLGTINRVDGYRVMSIKADVEDDVLVNDKVVELQERIASNGIPRQVDIVFKGEEKDRKEASAFLAKAFGTAVFLIALILLTQFNSFFSTIVILSAIVMSTLGVYIGLLVHDMAFGVVMGGIGVIALAGIIVSNNIILIDTYDRLCSSLENPTLEQMREVVLRTCAQRVRPVVLTQLTTVLGLLPIMFGVTLDFLEGEVSINAPSTQWWRLLSTCIVYGVTFASFLTLIVTPCALMARVKRRAKKGKPLI